MNRQPRSGSSTPHAVIVPLGVPVSARGIGLGLAALIHGFARTEGTPIALAQLFGREKASPATDSLRAPPSLASSAGSAADAGTPSIDDEGPPIAVEAFIPPDAWRDIAARGPTDPDLALVITGTFEPPGENAGSLMLLAFDPSTGKSRATIDAWVCEEDAGADLVTAFETFAKELQIDWGPLRELRPLSWASLESLLYAERAALYDPTRGGPHDALAALSYFERAVSEDSTHALPKGRLAVFAVELAAAPRHDDKMAQAALRALLRADAEDAESVEEFSPSSDRQRPDTHSLDTQSAGALRACELSEAACVVELRLGHVQSALSRAKHLNTLIPQSSQRYALLAEALRADAQSEAALATLDRGLNLFPRDPQLSTSRGTLLVGLQRLEEAKRAFREVLLHHPLHPAPFLQLAAILQNEKLANQTEEISQLIDEVLASPLAIHNAVPPQSVRCALKLAMAFEPEGLARAARIEKLATLLSVAEPGDPWAHLMLARAYAKQGETTRAKNSLIRTMLLAPESAYAAEAKRGEFALNFPTESEELDQIGRAAVDASGTDLVVLLRRAIQFTTTHEIWTALLTRGIIEQRLGNFEAAKQSLLRALALEKGATPAWVELSRACLGLGDANAALDHAKSALGLEGATAKTCRALAEALFAQGRKDEALAILDRGLLEDPNDESNLAYRQGLLAAEIATAPAAKELGLLASIESAWRSTMTRIFGSTSRS